MEDYKKFYLVWSYEEPLHPKENYGVSWDSGITWLGQQIQPPDKSFNQWKEEEIEKYNNLLKSYNDNNFRIASLKVIHHPRESDITSIENDIDFIKWC